MINLEGKWPKQKWESDLTVCMGEDALMLGFIIADTCRQTYIKLYTLPNLIQGYDFCHFSPCVLRKVFTCLLKFWILKSQMFVSNMTFVFNLALTKKKP